MRSSLMFLPIAVLLLTAHPSSAQSQDATIRDKATGVAVVSTTLRKIKQTCIFPNDFFFMRRVAWVESHFGADKGTFVLADRRGIWQLGQQKFAETQNTTLHPNLYTIYQGLRAQLNVNWPSVTFGEEYMNKPLYNAIAARIYMQVNPDSISRPIPPAVDDQAVYWKSQYAVTPGATKDKFLKEIKSMQQCKSSGVDLVLLLDGSGSITWSGFEEIKRVVYQIVNSTDIGPNRTNVAIYVFSTGVTAHVSFANTAMQNKPDLLTIVNNIPYPGGWTYTHLALQWARYEFTLARNLSLGFPRQLILLTDGLSTQPQQTAQEADILRTLPWLEVYSIGMGPEVNSGAGLNEITNIASVPKCTHVYVTPTVSEISALTDDLHEANCLASAPICDKGNCSGTITGTMSPGDVRYFRDEADRNVGRSYQLSTNRWTLRLYVSAKFENPGDGLYDFFAEAKPGSPAKVFVSPQFLQSLGYYNNILSYAGFNTNVTTIKLFSAIETDKIEGVTEGAPFSLDSAPGDKYKPDNGAGQIKLLCMPIILLTIIYMAFFN